MAVRTVPCDGSPGTLLAIGPSQFALKTAYARLVDTQTICGLDMEPSAPLTPKSPKGFKGVARPLVDVDWFVAGALCAAQGKRLPTQAEWERAARGPDEDLYATADGAKPDSGTANFDDNVGTTTEVGSYPPNGYGLYDMAGNVFEWTLDCFGSVLVRTDHTNPVGSMDSQWKGLRGGGWRSSAGNLKATMAFAYSPDFFHTSAGSDVGVRCAMSLGDSDPF